MRARPVSTLTLLPQHSGPSASALAGRSSWEQAVTSRTVRQSRTLCNPGAYPGPAESTAGAPKSVFARQGTGPGSQWPRKAHPPHLCPAVLRCKCERCPTTGPAFTVEALVTAQLFPDHRSWKIQLTCHLTGNISLSVVLSLAVLLFYHPRVLWPRHRVPPGLPRLQGGHAYGRDHEGLYSASVPPYVWSLVCVTLSYFNEGVF